MQDREAPRPRGPAFSLRDHRNMLRISWPRPVPCTMHTAAPHHDAPPSLPLLSLYLFSCLHEMQVGETALSQLQHTLRRLGTCLALMRPPCLPPLPFLQLPT